MLLCHTSLFTVKCAQVIDWSSPLSLSHSLSRSLIFPPQFPAQEECAVIDEKSLQTALENFSFTTRKLVFSPLHTPSWPPNGAALPTSLLSLTIKWWLILACISIQLQSPFDFDAIDSSQNEIDIFWFLMVNYDNSRAWMKSDNLFIYQSVTYRLVGECHALMAL